MSKKTFKEILKEKTVTLDEAFADFTPEQNRRVQERVIYLVALMELRKLRKKLGLTQAELAKRASLPRTTVTKIESGTYNPTVNTLMQLAAAMDKKLVFKLV